MANKAISVNTERLGAKVAKKLKDPVAKEHAKHRVRQFCSRLDFTKDWFFQLLMREPDACQAFLRLTFDPDITVCGKVKTSEKLAQYKKRSVTLDVLCKDKKNRHINIEMQRSNNVAHLLRVGYHLSMLQVKHTQTGDRSFRNVARVAVVYVTDFDLFHQKDGLYRAFTMLDKYHTPVDMGKQAVFVNLKASNDAKIQALSRLLKEQEVSDEVVNDKDLSTIANTMKDLTTTEKGEETMSTALAELCKLFEAQGKKDGEAKGEAKGRAEGEAKGRAEGFFEGMLNSIKCMMQNKHTGLDEAFNTLSIPQDERPKYRAALAMA